MPCPGHPGQRRLRNLPARHADQHVRAAQRRRDVAVELGRVGERGQFGLGTGQVRPPVVERATRIADDDVAAIHTPGDQHLRDRHAGGSGPDHRDPEVAQLPVKQPRRVAQRRQHDHGRTVLVVVKDRNRQRGVQPALDLEAARRGDVLQVDAAKRRC